MEDQIQDTIETPSTEGQAPVAPETPTPEVPSTPPAPPEPSMEDRIVDRITQNLQSFEGRKAAKLRQEILETVASQMPQYLTPYLSPTPDPQVSADAILTDPESVISQVLDRRERERSGRQQQYILQVGSLLDNDPILSQESQRDLGMEVVAEIQKIVPPADLPTSAAAQYVVAKAKEMVFSRKYMTKINPLEGRTPVSAPIGTVTPSAPPPSPTPKVNLTDDIRRWGKKMGYKNDDEISAALVGYDE